MLSWLTALFQAIGKALGVVEEYDPPPTAQGNIDKDEATNAQSAQDAQDGRP